MNPTVPPGSWPSPISADLAVTAGRTLEAVAFAGRQVWWSEGRPAEAGRICVCTTDPSGLVRDLLPAPWNAEHGCTSTAAPRGFPCRPTRARVRPGLRQHVGPTAVPADTRGAPVPLTPEPTIAAGLRYADLQLDERRGAADRRPGEPSRRRHVRHRGSHRSWPFRSTAARTQDPSAVVDLLAGRTGRATSWPAPRLSPAGDALVWISWNHPDMPWDSTTAQLAEMDRSGKLGDIVHLAGGPGVSVVGARIPAGWVHPADQRRK